MESGLLPNYIISLLAWCNSLDQIINCIVSFRVQIKIIRLCYVLDIILPLKYKYFELLSKHKGPLLLSCPWAPYIYGPALVLIRSIDVKCVDMAPYMADVALTWHGAHLYLQNKIT